MDDDLAALRNRCSRALNMHGNRTAAQQLAELPAAIELDRYGEHGAVAELEVEVADLLGKAAAVFMPSGTMAQQIALRIHADRRSSRVVALHPTSHLELHELRAHERLHALTSRPVGSPRQLMTLDDLQNVAEPLAAVLFELPQREIGGLLPAWDDLVAQTTHVRQRGAATHLDGARLWDAQPFYDRPLAEIAGLFDTVYVSFYKTLGGLAGCCLVGDEDVVAEAREWRHRHGGTLFGLWPYAASALSALRTRLPRIPDYVAHAQAIAKALGELPGVDVIPEPPQTPMMHLLLETTQEHVEATARAFAEQDDLWTWPGSAATDSPRHRMVELAVGDATISWSADEVAGIVGRFVAPGARS